MNFYTALLTGLTTGGLTCLAVQGGLLIGLLAKQQDPDRPASSWQRLALPVSGFLVAKIVVYTIFGFILGAVGERLQFNTTTQAWLQGIAAVFMVVTGIKLIWPRWLPWLTINPPASIRLLVRRSARNELLAGPIILGAMTLLIPCGTTIAMEAAALTTGSPIQSASILFGFTLGTAPLFFVIGVLAKGAAHWQQRLKYVTAMLVIGIGLYSFNGVLTLIDSPLAWRNLNNRKSVADSSAQSVTKTNHPVIDVFADGYSPSNVTVPAGEKVSLEFRAQRQLGCTNILLIPKLSIQSQLKPGASTVINAFFPNPGTYTFTCGMGMYSGTITAV